MGKFRNGYLDFNTGVAANKILDEDNMTSNDDEALATQQSIKKYVDDASSAATTPHGLDSTAHIGITGTEDNFMSIDVDGLPKDSTYNATDFESSGAVSTHESTYDHTDLHEENHSLDGTTHTGITGTEDNFMSLDSNGLPKDSGYKASDFGGIGDGPHGLDSTTHIGISGTVDNFMSIDVDGLPKDSTFSYLDFKRKSKYTLDVGYNAEYSTISDAITAASSLTDATTFVRIRVDHGTYNENITMINNIIISGMIGSEINGSVTCNISEVAYIEALYVESYNTPAIIKSGSGTLYSYNMTAYSEWDNDDAIQSVIRNTEGFVYSLGHCIYTLEEDSSYATTRVACIYDLSGSNLSQIRSISSRHIVNATAANFHLTIVHNTNTNTGNRTEVLDTINNLTSNHASAPANRISLINHDSCVGYSIFDNNKVFTYAPNNAGATYVVPAYCYNGSNWNTVSITKCFFQWADIDDADVYIGASTHSFNVLLVNDCIFSFGTDVFPQEYTTDGSAGSIFYTITNSYGSKNVSGSGGNLAITNLAQNITGGWTFQTGSPEFKVSPVFDNDVIWLGRNSSSGIESVMWPRASDDNTYINYGSGGNFYIRNNSSTVQYRLTDTLIDVYDKDINNISRASLEQRTTDVSTPDDGDLWYRSDDNNFRARTNTRTHEVGLVQVVQVYSSQVTNLNTGTPTAIPFNNEDGIDDLYTHSNVTNNSRITINGDCIVRITYQVNMNGATGRRQVRTRIRVNGTTYLDRSAARSYGRNAANPYGTNSCSFIWNFTTNDYIEVMGDEAGDSGIMNTIANEVSLQIELIRYR